jgi:hypothetical protein
MKLGRYTVVEPLKQRWPLVSPADSAFSLAVHAWSEPLAWVDTQGEQPMDESQSWHVAQHILRMKLESGLSDDTIRAKHADDVSAGRGACATFDRFVLPTNSCVTAFRPKPIAWPTKPAEQRPVGTLAVVCPSINFFGRGQYWSHGLLSPLVDFERNVAVYVPLTEPLGTLPSLSSAGSHGCPGFAYSKQFAGANAHLVGYTDMSVGWSVRTFVDPKTGMAEVVDPRDHREWVFDAVEQCLAGTGFTIDWVDRPAPPDHGVELWRLSPDDHQSYSWIS